MHPRDSKPKLRHSRLLWLGVGILFLAALNAVAPFVVELFGAEVHLPDPDLEALLLGVWLFGSPYLALVALGVISAAVDQVRKARAAWDDQSEPESDSH
jgi:hypothetical protein